MRAPTRAELLVRKTRGFPDSTPVTYPVATPMTKAASDARTGADVERVLACVADVLGRFCGDAKPAPTVKRVGTFSDFDIERIKATKILPPTYRLYEVTDTRNNTGFRYLTKEVGPLRHPTEIIVRYDTSVAYPDSERVRYRSALIRKNGKVVRLDTYAQNSDGKWMLCHSTDPSVQEAKAKTPLHPLRASTLQTTSRSKRGAARKRVARR